MSKTASPFAKTRHSISLGGGHDVLVIDTFGDVPDEGLDAIEQAAQELWSQAIEHRVLLIQMGPDSNVWPDRQQPGLGRFG